MAVKLNAFRLHYSSERFTAYKELLPDPKGLKALREKYGGEWFLHWRGGVVWGLPRTPEPKQKFGEKTELSSSDYEALSLLTARTGEQLHSLLPQYPPLPSKRGFRFVAQKNELVGEITKGWREVPELIKDFEIRPRFTCESRLIELQSGELESVLVIGISMQWIIEADIAKLISAGVDVSGLYAVRRERQVGQRSLLGRISRASEAEIFFDEYYDEQNSIPIGEGRLEPSKMSFSRCLKRLIGSNYERFWRSFEDHQARFLSGQGQDQCLEQLKGPLDRQKSIFLGPGISVAVGERIAITEFNSPQDVAYCYDPGRAKQHSIAWSGLAKFGPYSRDTFPKRTPNLLVVCPDEVQARIEQAMHKFQNGIPNNSVFGNGFARYFHLAKLNLDTCPIPIVRNFDKAVWSTYTESLEKHLQRRSDYDAALVVIGDQYSELPDAQNPYLAAKALLLTNGIPVQEAKTSTLSRPDDALAWVFQNLSVALYAKMGGVPWTVNQDQTVNDEVVIGMGLVETSGSRFEDRQRVVGITTVFRGDGNYLLANVSRECPFSEYRAELRKSMVAVLLEIKQRNGWRPGEVVRVVFHASKPLRDLEVDELMHECVLEAAPEQEVQFAFIDVLRDHPFRLVDTHQPGKPASGNQAKGAYVPGRGTALQLGKNTWLLSTNGVSQIKRVTTPLPSPLLIHLHRKSTGCDLAYLTDQVLKFTSLTWRSTQPASEPVTIYYSELIAGLLTRLKAIPGWSPNVLNTKLRASKWFL